MKKFFLFLAVCNFAACASSGPKGFTRILPAHTKQDQCKDGENRTWSTLEGYGCQKAIVK